MMEQKVQNLIKYKKTGTLQATSKVQAQRKKTVGSQVNICFLII
jgi:hypothetical protein